MPRLTRAESQARTRELLIATAQRMFLAVGYAATSLERVADEAGYSKGAVYSNFDGKDELCLAVLDRIHHEQVMRVARVMASARTLEQRVLAFESWAEANIGDPAWTGLEVEFAVAVRNAPEMQAELAKRDRAIRELIASFLDASAEEFGLRLPMATPAIATMLLSLGIGLGVQRAVDPTISVTVLSDAIRLVLSKS